MILEVIPKQNDSMILFCGVLPILIVRSRGVLVTCSPTPVGGLLQVIVSVHVFNIVYFTWIVEREADP